MNPHSAQIMRSRLSPSGTPRTDGPRPVSASAIMAGIIGTAPGGDKEPGCTPGERHPRESGGPRRATELWPLDSRLRGNDGKGSVRYAGTGMARWLYMILRILARSSSVRLAGSGG